jgi:glycosyltransferase involved in cell wall biosynthesis
MLLHRFYYTLKPFLPWGLRIRMRRVVAHRKLEDCAAVWPIDESAGRVPPGWTGWPDGKKFAVVLTHDVEGPEGLAKCRQLAELEMQLGFRSSFNFIPEGSYSAPRELRDWLVERGFEVGVHDLKHDGRLYGSRRGFAEKAARINGYLKDWGAIGFRSGFMLRNLDWIHQLDVTYDSSTFDTDPFEPQSNGTRTIFPFWIPASAKGAPGSHGYVELPYTLPQDSTLFLVLRKASPEIWLRKTDWIAQQGGMALVNVHPDYINFTSAPASSREYPATAYADLLRHISQKYAGQYWQPLPGKLASWFKDASQRSISSPREVVDISPPADLRGRKAAVILYSYYPSDPRPRRAAEAMVEAGMEVDLLCLSESPDNAREEVVRGVRIFRLPMQRRRGSRLNYLWQYGRFFFSSLWFLTSRSLRWKYDVVHVHNMPDFLVFAALLPKLRGARIILDLHDPMPELMITIYDLKPDKSIVRILRALERWSIRFADLVLTPNLAFKHLFAARSHRASKIEIVMNSPQQEIFNPDRFAAEETESHARGAFRIMHHGSIVHRHGIDLLVEAVALLRPKIPGIRLDIYGSETWFLRTVLDRAQERGVADIVEYHGPKTQREIADAIRRCDLGVVPNRRSIFTEINFPTRLFEYLSMRRPVVAPRTQGIRDYFGDDQMIFFNPGAADDLATQILWAWEHPVETRKIVRTGIDIYRHYLWSQEKARFLNLLSALCDRG